MTTTIAVKIRGDLEERYEEAVEELAEDEPKSKLTRELLEAGFRERDTPLFLHLDLPNKVAAQLENDRASGESDEVVTQRFLAEAVEAREADALDAIDAGEELRSLVERERDPGEPLDDAVRRLLRESCENTQDAKLRQLGGTWGMKTAIGFLLTSVIPLALILTAPSSIAATVGLAAANVMWILGLVAVTISIVANILLARPLRAAFGFEIDDTTTTAETGVGE